MRQMENHFFTHANLKHSMKLKFKINYRTVWGQHLCIVGNIPELGEDIRAKALDMNHEGNGVWTAEICVGEVKRISYRYFVSDDNGNHRDEWGPDRVIKLPMNRDTEILDTWRAWDMDKIYHSSAFTQGFVEHKADMPEPTLPEAGKILQLSINVPRVSGNRAIAVCGNCPELGNWKQDKAVVLSDTDFPVWRVNINADNLKGKIEYKYLLTGKNCFAPASWEYGENRVLDADSIKSGLCMKNDEEFRFAIPNFKCAGVAIPIFSLRSRNSFGIGEFSDLKPMVDWAKKTGQKVIQTLPVNDTSRRLTNADSYPYSAITVMALHPIYINPFEMGRLDDEDKMKYFIGLKDKFNASPTVMYQEVLATKMEYFRMVYEKDGQKTMDSPEFGKFMKENPWLLPYARFCYLRDKNGTADFKQWGEFATYNDAVLDQLSNDPEAYKQIMFHVFLQFHADKQLSSASEYALKNGVTIKGDIPIGISPESVEAWTEPWLFNLDRQAGAPPDPFSKTGQNWSLPTYNWEEMSSDGYSWWKNRFRNMGKYFQVYRIDHVLGFFRIWCMSTNDVQGLLGQFDPALPLDENEIRSYGMWFEYHRMVHPYIREYMLDEMFGQKAGIIKNTFLELVSPGIYRFQEQYRTQKQLEKVFEERKNDLLAMDGKEASMIYEKLLSLYAEVLFIEDSKRKGYYHPRIGLQNTYSYRDLDWDCKNALNRLYDDFFYHRHNEFWKDGAMRKLPTLLQSTKMLCCAEDLGMIPSCVPEVMRELQMLSLEIERMPKDPKDAFVPLDHIPYLSVCTTSTHDMAPLRLWWEEDRQTTQRYYNMQLGEWGAAPAFCEPWICEKIIARHLYSPAMLVILPFQDWISMSGDKRRQNPAEERINEPADPKHFWCYRMHVDIEDLMDFNELNSKIYNLNKNSGRIEEM